MTYVNKSCYCAIEPRNSQFFKAEMKRKPQTGASAA